MHEFNFCPESGHIYHNDRLMEIVPPSAREAFRQAAGNNGINVINHDQAPKRTMVLVPPTKAQQPK